VPAAFELFHQIGDAGSARIRRFITEHELLRSVRFRNVHYPEVETDLKARGGVNAPALWDGQRLFTGAEAIEARLRAFLDLGRGEQS
jgi:hypothetical protein